MKSKKLSIKPDSIQRVLLVTLKVIIAVTALILILAMSGLIFVQTEPGREFAREQLNQFVSSQLKGKFELKHLDKVGISQLLARDLIFSTFEGEKVITLDKIELNPSWSKLLLGTVGGSSATINGGIISLRQVGSTLTLVKVLSSPKPIEKRGEPIHLLFENMTAKNLRIDIDVSGFPGFSIMDLDILLRLELDKIVKLKLSEGRAETDFPLIGETKMRQMSGLIKSKSIDVLDLDLNMELGEMVPTHIRYRVPKNEKKPGEPKMTFIFSKNDSPSGFPKLTLKAADKLSQVIDVEFKE